MPRSLPILDRAALEAMHTGSLLSRLRKLLACEESREASDRPDDTGQPAPGGVIEFKQTAEWIEAHRELKEVLAHREHLPSAQERRVKRMARAASNRTKEKRK
jgi:hypothetical protein